MIMLLWDGYGLGFQESMMWEEVQRMTTFIGMTKRVLSVGELDKQLVGLEQLIQVPTRDSFVLAV